MNVGSKAGICDGLLPYVDEHSVALRKDGGPVSLVTGASLIARFDKECVDGKR
jgi:hypothetical protein